MRRKITVLLLILFLNLGVMSVGYACERENPDAGSAGTTAWWTLLYERPNPERLPVKVKFWLASKQVAARQKQELR